MNHPLCELHLNGNEALGLEGNQIVAAEDVHHIISPFDKGMEYMLDPYNLMALCKQCHGTIHSHHLESTLYPIYDKRRND